MKICEPLVDIEDKSELKNWSSEFIAALADWYDRFVMEDNIVSSVFKPTGTQNKAFVVKKMNIVNGIHWCCSPKCPFSS